MSPANRKLLEDILRLAPDCGDNSCRYRYRGPNIPSGMRTNGGCRCIRTEPNNVQYFAIRMKQFCVDLLAEEDLLGICQKCKDVQCAGCKEES